MKTDYVGIDYGLGKTNIDNKTGIRYGVINQHDVGQNWYEESEPYYFFYCPECGSEIGDELPDDMACPNCKEQWEGYEFDMIDPSSFFFENNEYSAECGEDGDIFILKSPYFTYAQFCSPCAPGAGYLMNWTDPGIGIKTYCLGHEWFEEKAPYPVYSVKGE